MPSDRLAAETTNDLENELDKFRNDWQKELNVTEKLDSAGRSEVHYDKKSGVERGQLRPRPMVLKQSVEDNQVASDLDYEQPETTEDKAKYLFNKAVLLEQQGRHYDAIKFYRLSMQLDADIEFKVAGLKKSTNVDKAIKKLSSLNLSDEEESDLENTENKETEDTSKKQDDQSATLFETFQQTLIVENRLFCEKKNQQKVKEFPVKKKNHKILCYLLV